MIELAFAIVTPANQRLDFSGVRIKNHDGGSSLRRRLPFFFPPGVTAITELHVDVLRP